MGRDVSLIDDYFGFFGFVDFADTGRNDRVLTASFGDRDRVAQQLQTEACNIAQLIRPESQLKEHPALIAVHGGILLLAGTVEQPASWELLVSRVPIALEEGDYHQLARIRGDFAGCFVTEQRVFLFKSLPSTENIFYIRDGSNVTWSTDMNVLFHHTPLRLDQDSLVLCCWGIDEFVYPDVDFVPSGHVVVLERHSLNVIAFDGINEEVSVSGYGLQVYADKVHELLLDETRPVASSGRVGVLLSGGIDSSAILAALVENGADVVAYHYDMKPTAANEIKFAKAVCKHLSVPLVPIEVSYDSEYLPSSWNYAVPYNHAYYSWFEQVAEIAKEDGVRFMVTGVGADAYFGCRHYSLYHIMRSNIPVREKGRIFLGILSMRWLLPNILKSITGWSFVRESGGAGIGSEETIFNEMPWEYDRADFLSVELSDTFQKRRLDFSMQDHVTESNIWKPKGIRLLHPYCAKSIQSFSKQIPEAYGLLPFHGQRISKPILRLAFGEQLPPMVVSRIGRSLLDATDQDYCIRYSAQLRDFVAGPHSRLRQLKLIMPDQVDRVFSDTRLIRRNTSAIVNSAMTELFLQYYESHMSART